ncbi:flavin reductase family protein [Ornithinibacillus sp. 4-3]|uniref:Flavin reductase family protein n=1 Tax=Ornithinibacillus sp. 4-3 TaxID=3231488 RepID=A0AB39HQ85_9BACI
MIINPNDLDPQSVYKLLSGAVVPRPIAWVSTVSQDGIANIAPYSFFTIASRNPPTLVISVGVGTAERAGTVKDTLTNIREQKDFVVNIVTASLANEMQYSSENLPSDVDEFAHIGLTAIDSEVVKAPRLLEAPISMELTLHDIIPIGEDHLILGRVVRYHVKDELYENGKINLEKLAPLGRLAGNYSPVETIFSLPNEQLKQYLKSPVDRSK